MDRAGEAGTRARTGNITTKSKHRAIISQEFLQSTNSTQRRMSHTEQNVLNKSETS